MSEEVVEGVSSGYGWLPGDCRVDASFEVLVCPSCAVCCHEDRRSIEWALFGCVPFAEVAAQAARGEPWVGAVTAEVLRDHVAHLPSSLAAGCLVEVFALGFEVSPDRWAVGVFDHPDVLSSVAMAELVAAREGGGGGERVEGPGVGVVGPPAAVGVRGVGAPRKGDDWSIAVLVASGWGHQSVASELGISARTVARRCAEPNVQAMVAREVASQNRGIRGRVLAVAHQAMDAIVEDLTFGDARVRSAAARFVVDRAMKLERFAEVALLPDDAFVEPRDRADGWEWPAGVALRLDERPDRIALDQRRDAEAQLDVARDAIRRGVWVWDDLVALIGGQDQLIVLRRRIMAAAVRTRDRRQRGLPPVLGDPYSIAAEIIAFAPGEPLAPHLSRKIDDHLDALSGLEADNPGFVYAVAAGLVKLVLRDPNAWALRTDLAMGEE